MVVYLGKVGEGIRSLGCIGDQGIFFVLGQRFVALETYLYIYLEFTVRQRKEDAGAGTVLPFLNSRTWQRNTGRGRQCRADNFGSLYLETCTSRSLPLLSNALVRLSRYLTARGSVTSHRHWKG